MMKPRELYERLRGPIVASTTPFKSDLSLDLDGLCRLIDFYIDGGIPTIIVDGSTGEFASLTDQERRIVIQTSVEHAAGRAVIIAGCAHSGTQIALDLTRFAQEVGADGVMITPPYYGFSGFEGLCRHYEIINDATDIGIVVYFSGAVLHSVQNIIADPALLVRLCEIPNVVAFKDATRNWAFYRDVSLALDGKVATMGSQGMSYYLWGRIFGSPCFLTGLGNIWPEVEVDFWNALENGDRAQAEQIVLEKDLPFLKYFTGVSRRYCYNAALKALLDMEGLPGGPVRPPNLDWPRKELPALRAEMERLGLLCAPSDAPA